MCLTNKMSVNLLSKTFGGSFSAVDWLIICSFKVRRFFSIKYLSSKTAHAWGKGRET